MNILTIGASPYLLVRNGRINSGILRRLKQQGHNVVSAVWHHDEGYFLADETGIHRYEYENKAICNLIPFVNQGDEASPVIYEIMKKTAPDIVITIGDYKETDFVYSIKAMLPNLFKWIAIIPIDCLWINSNHKERLEYADCIVTTSSFGYSDITSLCNVSVKYIPYGPPDNFLQFFGDKYPNHTMKIINSSKNAQSSNLGAFVKAVGQVKSLLGLSEEKIEAYLHTNLYDIGDYDLKLLIKRYGADIKLPECYISVKDGPSDIEMAEIYRSHDFIVDCSVKSATALSVLESMLSGCIPVGMNVGRVGEIISELPEEFRLFVPYETYVGKLEEEYAVISIDGLAETLIRAKETIFDDADKFVAASGASFDIAWKYSEKEFLDKIEQVVLETKISPATIAVDTF